ncbi:unnamed protein product [Nezara viridula]|uniref:Uncharacterized protein n=1 Tax=Nezara viridula TaxID=85310 RepID=A0A9P0HI77_NEZVI|nr:unnamed protein product [Nezara viridula]
MPFSIPVSNACFLLWSTLRGLAYTNCLFRMVLLYSIKAAQFNYWYENIFLFSGKFEHLHLQ